MATIPRFPHQTDIVDKTMALFKGGDTDLFAVATMGSGKTTAGLDIVYSTLHASMKDALDPNWMAMEDAVESSQRCLWLAHREELIWQARHRWDELYPHLQARAGVVMNKHDENDRQIIFATVQTLYSQGTWRRLNTMLEAGAFRLLVIDETHHATADTYMDAVDKCREAAEAMGQRFWRFGMTATPHRTDKAGMVQAGYQKCVAKYGIKEMIQAGVVVPFKAFAIETGISVAGVKRTKDGDLADADLAKVMDTDNAFDLVVESYKKYGDEKQFIGFTSGVAGAHALAAKFNAEGIPCAAVDGTTKADLRVQIIKDFKSGKIRGLTNCNVYTEGLDLPTIEVVLWCRPTTSDLVYMQGAFRGGRRCDEIGKEHFTILDFVPIEYRDIVQAADLLGKPKAQRVIEKNAEEAGTIISAFSYTGEGTGIDGDPDELVARPLKYLSLSPYAWFFHDGLATLDLGQEGGWNRCLALTRASDSDGLYRLLRAEWMNGQERVIMQGKSADYSALANSGTEYAEKHAADTLVRKDARWGREEVSEKQLWKLSRLLPNGFPPDRHGVSRVMSTLSKGEASKLIGHLEARGILQRKHEEILARRAAVAV